MKLYIDCEWDIDRLLSLALVAEDGSAEFYEVLGTLARDPWVQENVIPMLGRKRIEHTEFRALLAAFLAQWSTIHIVADWPEDIAYFCTSLITGPGTRIDTPPLTLEVVRVDTVSSAVPHNALADARAIRDYFEAEGA